MNYERLRRALVRNTGAKIASLVFAIFLWLHVTAQQGESQSFRVPLHLTGIPDSLTIIHKVPGEIGVTIRGPRSSLLKLRLQGSLKATVDISMAKKGRENILLSPAILNLSEDFDPRDITFDDPKSLSLNFEQVITKSVPVRIAYKGGKPENIIVSRNPVVIPARVQVRGASSVISAIDFLSTAEIDIRSKRGKISEESELMRGGREISIVPPIVLVEMEIHKRISRTLANIPPTLLQDNADLSVEYSPRVVSITIEGAEDIIRKVVVDDVSVILNITAHEPGKYQIVPEVIVPGGIEKYFLDTDLFEITISAGRREKGKASASSDESRDGDNSGTKEQRQVIEE
ncbi:MAG: hypothetical protein JW746_08395 [Candidatus Krumholzibacteriota bacterium]|nr:hypothetical protein [Candidatus Krumholzibacteriota bacterium]